MLARCGGRLALAVEFAERSRVKSSACRGGIEDVLQLWQTALETDGGGPEPRAHRLLFDAMPCRGGPQMRDWLPEMYVEKVARVDLDAEAVPTLVGWIRESAQAGEPMDAWVRALGAACTAWRFDRVMNGSPALLRALCEAPETESLAIEVLAGQRGSVTTRAAVLKYADRIEEQLAASARRRRRAARMTADDVEPGGADRTRAEKAQSGAGSPATGR